MGTTRARTKRTVRVAFQGLDTPVVVVDLDILEQNLATMAARSRQAGVRLRPHVKTHKSLYIARQQLALGASGITVAKLGEAEVMARGGVEDILIAYPLLGRPKLERLRRLVNQARVLVAIDSVQVARGLSDLAMRIGAKLEIYFEVDSGHHRCGLAPGQAAAEAASLVATLPGLFLRGLMTHAGHAYRASSRDEIRQIALLEAAALVQTRDALAVGGVDVPELSVGSTPTATFIGDVHEQYPDITEMRPGNYVFHDANQIALGVAEPGQCALRVLATIVSRPAPDRMVADFGTKTVGADAGIGHGYGEVLSDDGAAVEFLTEEHAVIRVSPGSRWRVGDRVEVIPNHACVVPNLADWLVSVRGGLVDGRIRVDARGKNH